MKIQLFISSFSKPVLLVCIFFFQIVSGWSQSFTEDVVITERTEYAGNITLDGVSTNLTVTGTGILVVKGDLIMNGNKSSLTLMDGSVVIIYGDLIASNMVTISAQSHLIIYGSLTRTTGSTKGTANFDAGKVYIFGDVDPTWELQECDSSVEDCDYGDEEDFLEGDVPDEVQNALNCFSFPGFSDITICEGGSITLGEISTPAGDTYKWQSSIVEDVWTDISSPSSTPTFELSSVTADMSGTRYRVVVNSSGECLYGVSEPIVLTVQGDTGLWTGVADDSWSNPENWTCNIIPDSSTSVIIPSDSPNFPVIGEGIYGHSADITIEVNSSLTVSGTIEITGTLLNFGTLNAEDGTLAFRGTTPQSVPANSLSGNRIKSLIVDNPAGVTLEGELGITETLFPTQGTFETNDFLTLISDATQTALISGSGNGSVTGDVNIQRFLVPAFGYKYFSSPITGATVGDFQPFMTLKDPVTNFPHFYRYQEDRKDGLGNDLSGWEAYNDPTNLLNPLEGYALNLGTAGGPVTISISGLVNDGPQSRTLTNHNGTYTGGFHLVGNPYPSPIDWNSAVWTKDNIDDAIYFFTASTTDPYTGTYQSYVKNGVSTDGKTTGIIPSMQGFFVHVSDGATQGTLGVSNEVRIHDLTQEFHKSSQQKNIPLIRITAGFEGQSSDPTVLYLDPNASEGFDSRLDAYKLMNTNPDVPSFYSLSTKGEELSINAIGALQSQEVIRIPLGYQALKPGKLTLRLQDLELPSDIYVYLVDLEKNAYTDLLKERSYSTPVIKGSINGRFQIVFSSKAISDPEKILNTPMSVYGNKEKITVLLNHVPETGSEITISSLSGQVLKTIRTTSAKVEIEGVKSAGVYIISLRSGETRAFKKILIK